MNFEKEDLLTIDEIKDLIVNPDCCDKAKMMSDRLSKYFTVVRGKLYELDLKTIFYKFDEYVDKSDIIFTNIGTLISQSTKALTSDERDFLQLKYKAKYDKIFDKAVIKKYVDYIIKNITDDSIVFDNYYNQLHFINGYINLKNGKLYKRKVGVHYITTFVDRKYKKSSEESRNALDNILKQIYVDENDREVLLYKLLQAFTGMSSNEKESLFLLGLSNTGKSTIMNLLCLALPCYVFELASNTFVQNNPDKNKIISSFLDQAQILIAWVNEMEDKKIDKNMFKEFVEGIVKFTLLYKNGLHKVNLKNKTVFTSNDVPNFIPDSGVITRITALDHVSVFTKNLKEVDNIKVFLADDKLLLKRKDDDDFKNAVVDLVVKYCIDYNNKDKPEIQRKYQLTQSFRDATDAIVFANDKIQDFIDATLDITNDKCDRIGKLDMLKAFQAKYQNQHIAPTQLLSSLKAKKIKYEGTYTENNIKGVWVGVKFKNPNEDFMFENQNEDDMTVEGLQNLVKRLTKSNSQLTKQVEDLTAKLLQYEKPQEKIVEEIEDIEENEKAHDKSEIEDSLKGIF